MRSHSKGRGHAFDVKEVYAKLLEAFQNTSLDFLCNCGRPHCSTIMQLFGENGISADREDDLLGYGDEHQTLTLVAKSHKIKYNSKSCQRSAKMVHNIIQKHETMHKKSYPEIEK